MDQMVEIKNVSKTFGSVRAVYDASLSLARGAFLTVLGPSGCGKTTLLRIIAGFVAPTEGEVQINGKHVADIPPYKRSIGMVFQNLALFPHMTAAQNIAYPLKMRRFDRKEIPDRVSTYLRLVRLDGLGDRRPQELSGGQQQRVAIARALSFSPDLLLLDEPLSALDKKLREGMQLEFRRIQQELGVTAINVTHDQREALVMSDQIVVMNDGVVQQSGTPSSIYREPNSRFVASFIGVTSTFAATVCEVNQAMVAVTTGDVVLKARASGTLLEKNTAVECAIRAEQIRIFDDESAKFDNMMTGTVEQRIFEGDRVMYEIRVHELNDSILYVFDHDPASHQEYPIQNRVQLGWNARDLHVFPASSQP